MPLTLCGTELLFDNQRGSSLNTQPITTRKQVLLHWNKLICCLCCKISFIISIRYHNTGEPDLKALIYIFKRCFFFIFMNNCVFRTASMYLGQLHLLSVAGVYWCTVDVPLFVLPTISWQDSTSFPIPWLMSGGWEEQLIRDTNSFLLFLGKSV